MTEEERRLKEIKYLKYLKSQLIKQTKKELKALQQEEDMIYGYKRIEKEQQENVRTLGKRKRR